MHAHFTLILPVLLIAQTHAYFGSCTSYSSPTIPPQKNKNKLPSLADPNYHPNIAPRTNRNAYLSGLTPAKQQKPTPASTELGLCLQKYAKHNWGTWSCGGYEWYRRGDGYYGGGASSCTSACACLEDAVDGGLSDAECQVKSGAFKAGGRCWMGFRPLAGGVDVG